MIVKTLRAPNEIDGQFCMRLLDRNPVRGFFFFFFDLSKKVRPCDDKDLTRSFCCLISVNIVC